MQLKTIKVYGRLRKFLGSSYFEAAVSSPAEAIRFLMCNFPEVEAHMCQQYYKVKMNDMDVPLDFLSMSGKGDIQIIPIATGSLPAVAAVVSVLLLPLRLVLFLRWLVLRLQLLLPLVVRLQLLPQLLLLSQWLVVSQRLLLRI
jgi:predicted phage tail protein